MIHRDILLYSEVNDLKNLADHVHAILNSPILQAQINEWGRDLMQAARHRSESELAGLVKQHAENMKPIHGLDNLMILLKEVFDEKDI